ncbi:MAG: aminotransferase class V-fold PLP-dependent enzyme [Candidatus Latescibacteria bacterium]|nr:aminotransferase class V-fold PLP-dependent enzyme [Candidatus Latescibacterota bacterium]NIM66378.1 aminotransferase class V-fold PLP-dependent enzyme [Candidatus Latescibacterota bacterium]NIO02857.1 aminotransferase class V-fold PLP-dependent enzyme [Candidatus Latescibacterota bacterium]NIO29992.1 aminotransferase class V-fold PLP-dependent enzyme [Candidatus Latescibacterota bacterium]NIO57607.1 aminotransferase class V-fold PLP-dependent enzyme [Candidatus Latescibacterota bacterium]
MEEIYMDYNSTAPIRAEVCDVVEKTIRDCHANPSSLHLPGRRAKAVLDDAREKVAEALGARSSEIIFVSGGSESNNAAIKGIAWGRRGGHIITSAIEHPAVLETCRFLESRGFSVTYVGVGSSGRVDPEAVAEAVRDDTCLITIMWANNETGVIQPVDEIARIASEHGIVIHTDAVQAFGKVPVDVSGIPVGLLSISGHKVYAPKGVGVLYVRRGIVCEALVHGGGQERGMRSGTENLPGIAGMGEAASLAVREIKKEAPRLAKLRKKLETGILKKISGSRINGDHPERLPNTTNAAFPGAEGEAVLISLDELGIAASSASACAANHADASHVLLAMGLSREDAEASMRFSLGKFSESRHIEKLLDLLPGIVERLRSLTQGG